MQEPQIGTSRHVAKTAIRTGHDCLHGLRDAVPLLELTGTNPCRVESTNAGCTQPCCHTKGCSVHPRSCRDTNSRRLTKTAPSRRGEQYENI